MLLGEVDILEVPAYFAPGISRLSEYTVGVDLEACNNNGFCEAGEDSGNCRRDCKPWGLVGLWLFILLLVTFAIYLALQEWYKRRYEAHLFKNEHELYNLINFIDNAEKQGMNKQQIYNKLKAKGWDKERIDYAWKKYKGERTGLWEIPVFKFAEKLKVKKEINKRHKQGAVGTLAPIPGASPRRPIMNGHPLSNNQEYKKSILGKQNVNKGKPSGFRK